jgi:tetratricopeptide (TPR) repeat protein
MTRKQLIFAGVLPLVFALGTTACACLWDSDTLQMERLRFPGVLEIITGKFVRHSQAYYEWRIKDRLKKLESMPNDPALIDDLAVGYDKLGRYDEGIAVLEKSLAADPNRYETLANLATLLFHTGRLEESKQHVQRALEINPNAHFGREKYQLLLTEYVLQSELEAAGIMCSEKRSAYLPQGFAKFALSYDSSTGRTREEWSQQQDAEVAAATKGVLGMMHFADYQSPILLEALGDLLSLGEPEENMTQLAARAYLRASQTTKDEGAAKKYRQMASDVLRMHEDFGMLRDEVDVGKLEAQLAKEMAEGKASFAAVESQEQKWIAANDKDVDREFAAVYYDSFNATLTDAEKHVHEEWPNRRFFSAPDRLLFKAVGLLCVAPLTIIGALIGFVWWRRRSRHASSLTAPQKQPA